MATMNNGRRLTQEQKASIPLIYAQTGSKQKTAELLGCSRDTVRRHLDDLTGEEWERIRERQRKLIVEKSVELLFQVLELLPEKLPGASLFHLVGAYKILAEKSQAFGGLERPEEGPSGLELLLAEGEKMRLTKAIDRALTSGDLEELRELRQPSGPLGS
jgi:biotin operon repressor